MIRTTCLLLVTVSLCSGRSVVGPNEHAKELLDRLNLLIRVLGLEEIPIVFAPGGFLGKLDTMVLRGDDQTIREEDLDDGKRIELSLRFGWDTLYFYAKDEKGFLNMTSENNIFTFNATASYSKDNSCMESEIAAVSVDLGKLKAKMSPPNPEREAQAESAFNSLYSHYKNTINQEVNKQLGAANKLPITQSLVCWFLHG